MTSPLRIAILWHMHQPFYGDPSGGPFLLPWVRLHALKDYFGMAHMLRRHPQVRLTFNLVPSLLLQLDQYNRGKMDSAQVLTYKKASELTIEEKTYILKHFFSAHQTSQISMFPRYRSLFEKHRSLLAAMSPEKAIRDFTVDEWRDLQILFPLSYFDVEVRKGDNPIASLISKGGRFSEEDKLLLQAAEKDLLSRIIPEYADVSAEERIEISASPFYHPILPLLIDPQAGRTANPHLPEYDLRFSWPDDAAGQIQSARKYMSGIFGKEPKGIWPSEGSLSEETLGIMETEGIEWTAADEANLAFSLSNPTERDDGKQLIRPDLFYRSYRLQDRGPILYFRDHFLSDLIGFTYQHMETEAAVGDFISRLLAIARNREKDWIVPIILDGENAWEYYPESGRPFLDLLYQELTRHPELQTVTFSEACSINPLRLSRYIPGSWINANFDIWIGDSEDRLAWAQLRDARELLISGKEHLSPEQSAEAEEHLMIAEGSDWFWWYGRENYTPDLDLFDLLFRLHLQQIYRIIGTEIPERLISPLFSARHEKDGLKCLPRGPVVIVLDGKESSYFEWIDAASQQLSSGGAMHSAEFPLKTLYWGISDSMLHLRIDFHRPASSYIQMGFRWVIELKSRNGRKRSFTLLTASGELKNGPAWAAEQFLEIAVLLENFIDKGDQTVWFRLAMTHGSEKRIAVETPFLPLAIPSERDYNLDWQI